MNYENAKLASAPTPMTLNDRLNRVAESIVAHCDRIESVLARIHGTPIRERNSRSEVAQIRPTASLSSVVEALEQAQGRIGELATGVETIA